MCVWRYKSYLKDLGHGDVYTVCKRRIMGNGWIGDFMKVAIKMQSEPRQKYLNRVEQAIV
jgi:cell fate regulator YaaT (PSP1 superfamily)